MRTRYEIDVQKAILNKLRKIKKSFWFKIHDLITAGIPDIIGLINGRFIAIEVKKVGKKPTKLQLQIIKIINSVGGLAYWTDNAAIVDTWIKKWKKIL